MHNQCRNGRIRLYPIFKVLRRRDRASESGDGKNINRRRNVDAAADGDNKKRVLNLVWSDSDEVVMGSKEHELPSGDCTSRLD